MGHSGNVQGGLVWVTFDAECHHLTAEPPRLSEVAGKNRPMQTVENGRR